MQCWKLNFNTNRHSGEWLSKCTKTKKIWLPFSLKMPCNDSQIIRCFLYTFFVEFFWSRVTCTCSVGIRGLVSITTLDEHLDWCLISIPIDAQSTLNRILDQQSVDSLPSIERPICIQRKLVDSQGTVNRFVDRVLINWVSIECQLRVWIEGTCINQGIDHGYCSTLDRRMAYMYVYMYVHII